MREYTQRGKVCQQLTCVNEEIGENLLMTAVLLSNLFLNVEATSALKKGHLMDLRRVTIHYTQKWKLKCHFGCVHLFALSSSVNTVFCLMGCIFNGFIVSAP